MSAKETKACPHNDTFDNEEEGYTICPECGEIFDVVFIEEPIECHPKRHEVDIYSKMPDNIPAETKRLACLIHRQFCMNSGRETKSKQSIACCLYLGGIMAGQEEPLDVCTKVMGVKQTKHFQNNLSEVVRSIGFPKAL